MRAEAGEEITTLVLRSGRFCSQEIDYHMTTLVVDTFKRGYGLAGLPEWTIEVDRLSFGLTLRIEAKAVKLK